jgi:hypothetical protein
MALLHAGLILRIAGDLGDWSWVQKLGGAVNALAILLFLFNNIRAARSSRPR